MAIPLVVLKVTVACVLVVPGTARASARGLVVVVPVEEATYVAEYAAVEPPTEMVDAVKAPVAVRVSPDKVMVAVGPRDHDPPLLATVRVVEPELIALAVTSAPLLPAIGKNIAVGVPEKGRPAMARVPPGAMVLATPSETLAELTSIVTVRQAALVWQVSDTVTLVT